MTMIINEKDYRKKLKARGYKEIGYGLYATVLGKPKSKYVIKVYEDDGAYELFLNMIQKEKNPHFPKIYSIKEFEGKEGNVWARVKMEKLIPFKEPLNSTDKKHRTVKVLQRSLQTNETDYFDEVFRKFGRNLKLKKTLLYKAIRLVLDLVNERFRLDLHNENIMFRKIGNKMQLVITDPIREN